MLIQVGGHINDSQKYFAEIDEEDYEKVRRFKWYINKSNNLTYARTFTDKKFIYLHRLLMGLTDTKDKRKFINHIDGNGLNNTKKNMEICDNLYNTQSINKVKGKVGSVLYYKKFKKWIGKITIDKKIYSKFFDTEEEANDFIELQLIEYLLRKD